MLVAGCSFFRPPGRDDCDKILSREKMTDMLAELYLLETFFLEEQPFNPGIMDSLPHYYAGVFERHGVTQQAFSEALACYLLHEREIKLIHDELLKRFSIMVSQQQPVQFTPEEDPLVTGEEAGPVRRHSWRFLLDAEAERPGRETQNN